MVAFPDKTGEPPTYTDSDASIPPQPPAAEPLSASSSSPSSPAASSSIQASTRPYQNATNFLTIDRTNQSVKGTYVIDPAMPKPPGAIVSTSTTTEGDGDGDGEGRPLNMRVASKNGSVNVSVVLVRGTRGGDMKGPARFEVASENGSVTVNVRRPDPTPPGGTTHFHLLALSPNGSITVRLPTTFLGTISTHVVHGTLSFTAPLYARLTTFSEHANEGRFFLGDYSAAGYEGCDAGGPWLGDHLRVEAKNGSVRISFADEREECGKGFFGRLFGR